MKKNQHVLYREADGKWEVKAEGNQRASHVTETQREAIDLAREAAKQEKSELLIHAKDGRIREKNSYGNDPRNIKG